MVVIGRSATFVLQKLRSIEPSFREWYEPLKEGSDEARSALSRITAQASPWRVTYIASFLRIVFSFPLAGVQILEVSLFVLSGFVLMYGVAKQFVAGQYVIVVIVAE